jgi:uncharacterized glyoxalase superfamily protein PhnB
VIRNPSAPPGPLVPILSYENVAEAIRWLHEAFGFTERFRTPPGPDGAIHHAQMAVESGAVILTSPHSGGAGQNLFVPVEDADAHCETSARCGARIVLPPHNCEFGERQYTAEDPGGHRWTFSQSIAAVNPESWGAVVPAAK